jgi:hypothetical protein
MTEEINGYHERPVIPKDIGFKSEKLRRAVATLPCMICGLSGSTQASHSNQSRDGRGMCHKSSDACLAALCFHCHYDIDYGTKLSRQEKIELWDMAYRKTIRALIEGEYLVVDETKI